MTKLFTTALIVAALCSLGCKDEPVAEGRAPLVDLDKMPTYNLEGVTPAPVERARAAEVYVPMDEIEVRGEEMTMPPMEIVVPNDLTTPADLPAR